MKNWKSLPAICLLLFLSATHSSFGQGSIDELHSNALTAMKTARSKGMPDGAADWNAALGLLRQATNTYDGRAPQLFGPKFGWFWYHQGFCELKLGKFEEAIESFETCYTKYANKDGKQGNDYQIKSLLKWGEAAQGAQKWDVAIQQYKKFLAERDPERRTDNFEKGAFYINLAICHFSSDKIAGGLENLEIAIRNKDVFPTPAAGIMAGFQSLCETVIRLNKEQALIDFLKKNRAEVKLEPWEAQPFSPIFMKLAANALKANMGRAAFELYAMVPSSIEAKDDLRARLASLGDYRRPIRDGAKILQKDALDAQLDQTKEREKKGLLPEITALAATAFIH
ncbi:MAG: tetratricopeptide repeat protein [Verrucomicrobiota bacterium]